MSRPGVFTVAGIGFPEHELQLFKSIFFIARSRTRTYQLSGTSIQEPADILLVNGDDAAAVAQWDSYHARKPKVPMVLVTSRPLAARYQVQRPLRASRLLSVLDRVSIRELAFVPELVIDRQEALPDNLGEIVAHAARPPAEYAYTALVVEDSLAVRTLIEMELRMFGIRADLAESGEQALKLLHSNAYDIVFLDIVLADMDGYQVCKFIKRDWTKKATPVVMLTGRSSPIDRLRAKLVGCDSYLPKPVDPKTFKKTISQYLWLVEGHRPRHAQPPAGEPGDPEIDIRRGLEQGEFLLHYQPIIDAVTNDIAGFEALLRWQHPHHGFVAPKHFLPLAEKSGAIVPLGWWALEEACAYIKALQACHSGDPLSINVNLSARQFAQADLVKRLDEILIATGLEPRCLRLDVTEAILKEASADVLFKMRQLNERGICCQIDGFGSNGSAHLEYLQYFPAKALKIDRYYISRLVDSRRHAAVIEKIIHVAHVLGMQVIAVGVEVHEQLDRLRGLRCEYIQGFLFSQPVDGNRAIALVSAREKQTP